MGNQAVALGALKAGVNVVCGYPGTPSSEVLEYVARFAREEITDKASAPHVEWSVNEKTALEVCAGAAFSGARALYTCKQMGLNVAADPAMVLGYLGVEGGLVLLVADDPGPISSQTEQDTRQFAEFAHVPVLDPASVREALEMAEYAFKLSERHHTPVILRLTTRICHSNESLAADTVDFAYQPHSASGFSKDPRWVTFPPLSYAAHRALPHKLGAIAADFCDLPWNRIIAAPDDARIGIAASGVSWAYLRDALERPGRTDAPVRLLKMATVFPFPEQLALEFLDGLDEVLVFEELEPTLERALVQVVGKHHLATDIRGKLTGDVPLAGELSIDKVAEILKCDAGMAFPVDSQQPPVLPNPGRTTVRRLATPARRSRLEACHWHPSLTPLPLKRGNSNNSGASTLELPPRPPVLCAGCPHRASFYAVKRAMAGRKATFGGDIGCYTLGNAQPLDMVDSCLCMGGGFSVPQGMYWADPQSKAPRIGFVGDSTFFASGITPVVNAVYNRAPMTFVILDNATTAMTGTQPHPGTGIRMSVDATPADAANAISIVKVLEGCGVKHIYECDPFQLKQAIATVKEAVAVCQERQEPSAIVFQAPCIQLDRQLQAGNGKLCVIDEQKCQLCGVCTKALGCPALSQVGDAKSGGKVYVDATLCNGCGLCTQLCGYGAMEIATIPASSHRSSRL
jgi:indolepyruvate ferredoxin oxidoreductase alpha subunit